MDVEIIVNPIEPPKAKKNETKIRPVGVIDKKASKKAGKKVIVPRELS